MARKLSLYPNASRYWNLTGLRYSTNRSSRLVTRRWQRSVILRQNWVSGCMSARWRYYGERCIANRTFLIDPRGSVTATYDKIHMFDVDLADDEAYQSPRRISRATPQ